MKSSQNEHHDQQGLQTSRPSESSRQQASETRVRFLSSAQPGSEVSHIGNVTLFRAQNFFVHTVSARRRDGSRSLAGSTSLLEQIRWTSTERQHILESETRLLPDTALVNPFLQTEIVIPLWIEVLVVLLILFVGMAVHALGFGLFPAYQQDEGTLMADAWAVTHGLIQPYAYTYTQTFFGWIQLAGWFSLTGVIARSGNAIASGRALMLVLTAADGLFVYMSVNRLGRSRSAGLLALVLFLFSPLATTYQQEVSLDNIGVFWLLLSFTLLVMSNSRMSFVVFAGIVLGLAILSKEVFSVFVPAFVYVVRLHVTSFQRKFALVVFGYILFSVVSLFPLLALLKGELLPTGLLPWDIRPHPSLWQGMLANIQSAEQTSTFATSWNIWMQNERILFIVSAVALGINLLSGWCNPLQCCAALMLLSFWAFMLLTNIVFSSYLVIFWPLMAINIALAASSLLKWSSKRLGFDLGRVILIFGLIGVLLPFRIQSTQVLTTQNATNAQINAVAWIRTHVPENATVIVDSPLYADLREPGGPQGKSYPHEQVYWEAALDPDIRYTVLHDKWQNISYIVVDEQMQHDIRARVVDMVLLDRALHHATLVQSFAAQNGDLFAGVQIYQVHV